MTDSTSRPVSSRLVDRLADSFIVSEDWFEALSGQFPDETEA